jgi:hypothetical protein
LPHKVLTELEKVINRLTNLAVGTPILAATRHCSWITLATFFAFLADMHFRGVAESEEALVQVCRCTMSYKAVTLYLTELNTTKTCN